MTVLMAERGSDVGSRLRELREIGAMTQEELGDAADVHEVTISDIERGKRKPSARTIRKLAKALNVEVRDLTQGSINQHNRERADSFREEELARREAREGNADGTGGTGL